MNVDKKTGEVLSSSSHVVYSPRADFYEKQVKLDKMRVDKLYRERRVENSNVKFIFSFFYIAFAILLLVAVYRVASGMQPLYFTSFLEGLHNVPNITLDLTGSLTITADWGVFNFFRDFLNIFTGTLSVTLFVFTLIAQVILYIVYFLGLLFGIV